MTNLKKVLDWTKEHIKTLLFLTTLILIAFVVAFMNPILIILLVICGGSFIALFIKYLLKKHE